MLQISGFFTAFFWLSSLLTNPLTVQADYEALVAAELGFAQMAQDHGIREAFVENLDEQSVVFVNNQFRPGKSTYKQAPAGSGNLTWRPNYAEISASGTLGFTTGPFEFRRRTTEEPIAYGQFTSVWHKTASGQWKALIDFGCTHAKPSQPAVALQKPSQFAPKTTVALDTSSVGQELMQTELAFAHTARTKSLREAYQLALPDSDSIRLLREGYSLYEGQAARKLATASKQQIDYQPLQVVVASSGDLGFVYGYATVNQIRQGYLRIWRKDKSNWQLAHEVLSVKFS